MLPCITLCAADFSKKDLKRFEKEAKNEVKKWLERGYDVLPGSLPMQMQFEKSIKMQNETNEHGEHKYIVGTGSSKGETYNSAKLGAISGAKTNMVNMLASEYEGFLEADLANNVGVSVDRVITNISNKIKKQLGNIITLVEVYKENGYKNYEVTVIVAYSSQQAADLAKKIARQELEAEIKKIKEQE